MDLPDEETEFAIMMMERFGGKDGSGPAEAFRRSSPAMEDARRRVLAPWWMLSLINKSARQSRTCRWLDKKASIRGTTRAIDHTYSSTEMERRRVTRLADVTAGVKLAYGAASSSARTSSISRTPGRRCARWTSCRKTSCGTASSIWATRSQPRGTGSRWRERRRPSSICRDGNGRGFMRESAVLRERLQEIENMGKEKYRLDRVVAEDEDLLREVERSSDVQAEYLMSAAEFIVNICAGKKWVYLQDARDFYVPEGDFVGPKRNMEIAGLCGRCIGCSEGGDESMLYDLAHMDDRSMSNLVNECQHGANGLHEKARSNARKRLEEDREAMQSKQGRASGPEGGVLLQAPRAARGRRRIGRASSRSTWETTTGSALKKSLPCSTARKRSIQPEDVENSLREYVGQDLIEIGEDGVKITPRGSSKLARYVLRRIWENLAAAHPGANATREEGFGMSEGFACRKYEFGDEFFKIDMETTLLSALERGKKHGGPHRVRPGRPLRQGDDRRYEALRRPHHRRERQHERRQDARGDGHLSCPLRAYAQEFEGQDKAFPLLEPGAGDVVLGHAQRDVRRGHHGHTGAPCAGSGRPARGRAAKSRSISSPTRSRTARTGST